MTQKFGLPLVSILLFGVAVLHMVRAQANLPEVYPPIEPARAPFAKTVAATGLTEAQTENIAVGAHLSGIVAEVYVRVGQQVNAGDPLFRLDDRHVQAELHVRQANLAYAGAQLARLEGPPRSEELPVKEALVREAEAELAEREDRLLRGRILHSKAAISGEAFVNLVQTSRATRARLERARAEYELVKAGAWEADRAVARAAIAQARAQVDQTRAELERLLVRAPVEMLQVNVRPGEAVSAQPGSGLMVLGNVGKLHLRVQIAEQDIPRFRREGAARAALRGQPQLSIPLTFVRVEPYVVPKKSLSNDSMERVDTRVLQAIYCLERGNAAVYVGQQLDVFIDAAESR